MVIHFVGGFGSALDERNPIRELVEAERLGQDITTAHPPGQAAEGALYLEIGEFLSHARFYLVLAP